MCLMRAIVALEALEALSTAARLQSSNPLPAMLLQPVLQPFP